MRISGKYVIVIAAHHDFMLMGQMFQKTIETRNIQGGPAMGHSTGKNQHIRVRNADLPRKKIHSPMPKEF